MIKALFIFGTRPEAIKLCPVIRHMISMPESFSVQVCVTAQHRDLLDQVLNAFGVMPDWDLDVMRSGQALSDSMARIMTALGSIITEARPDWIIVQGDTTTTLCGALASFYARIPVAHVEAGLRTGDPRQPFPEEMNRVLVGRLANLHFAATEKAAQNLYREGVNPENVTVTGNTGVDAIMGVTKAIECGQLRGLDTLSVDPSKKLIVVTAHRRESFGSGLDHICSALLRIARRQDVQIAYPVHPNPNVREAVNVRLKSQPNIILLDPLDYVPFVDLMRRSYLILTDSGGIQEEAPSLGKPVLVLREKTERMEAVVAGTALLVGTEEDHIVKVVESLLDESDTYRMMAARGNPFGDGNASQRIAKVLCGKAGRL